MARHNKVPQVAKATGKRRVLEIGKDLLIAALTCSAVFLALQTPMASQVRGWVTPPAPTSQPVAQQRSEALMPYGIAARNSLGLYGASYDQALVGQVFEQLSPYLGEALATAGAPEKMTRRQWQALLDAPGFYCVFQGTPPLAAFSTWLGDGEALTGKAQSLLLAWDGSGVWLAWRDGSDFYRAQTQVDYEGHLAAALEGFSPNGAAFAYALARTDETYGTLDPDVLVLITAPQPQVYTAASPDFVGDGEALEQLLKALGFQSGVGSAYEAGGDLAINESGDRLRVSSGGTVTFRAGEDARYPVASAGSRPRMEEAALQSWDLLNQAAAPWKGETVFVLTGAEETAGGWIITFHGRLNGVPLLTGREGWCASFTVTGQAITDFTLTLRTYTSSGVTSLVPGERLAAAARRARPGNGRRLTLCYSDSGGPTLIAGWVSED